MIENISFLTLWITMPLIWLALLRISGLSLLRLTIPSFLVAFMLVFQYIGLPVLFFELDSYRAHYVTDRTIVMQVFYNTSITITLMLVGFAVARQYFGKLSWHLSEKQVKRSKHLLSWRISKLNLGVLIFAVISLAVLLLYLSKVENVALFTLFSGTGDISAKEARSAMGDAFTGIYHWYKVFMNDILVYLVFISFGNYLTYKKLSNKMIFFLLFFVASFVMIMAIEKYPMANFLMGLFLVYITIRKNGKLTVKSIVFPGIGLLSLLSVFYIYFMNAKDAVSAISGVFSRVLTGSIQPAYHYLEYFRENEFLYGSSFPNPGGILPFENFRLTVEIMNWVHPELTTRGIVGSMPAVFWGDMYANFGFLGVLIPPFFVGFGLYWLNRLVFRLRCSPLSVALFVWLTLYYKGLSITSLTQFITPDLYMLFVVCVFIVLAFFIGNGKIAFKKGAAQT